MPGDMDWRDAGEVWLVTFATLFFLHPGITKASFDYHNSMGMLLYHLLASITLMMTSHLHLGDAIDATPPH